MTDSIHNPQSAIRNPLHFLVIGAGAIGCLVGGTLAQGGVAVTLAGRQRFVDAVKANGLRLISGDVTQRIDSIYPAASLADAFRHAAESRRPFDVAILTVKSYDTLAALAELQETAAVTGLPVPPILSLQNGVGNENAIAAAFGPDKTIAGTITAPVEVPDTGVVRLTKPQWTVGLACWDAQRPSPVFEALQAQLSAAGIVITPYADAVSMKWTKLLMNQIGNASSAILAQPPAVTFAHPAIANLEISALRETLAVMAGLGVRPVNVEKYPLGTLAPLLRFGPRWLLRPLLRKIVSGARGGKMPSLYLDLEAGKTKNEVLWYNGAVARYGEGMDIPVPINRLLCETVLHLAAHPQEREHWSGNVAKLAQAVKEEGR